MREDALPFAGWGVVCFFIGTAFGLWMAGGF